MLAERFFWYGIGSTNDYERRLGEKQQLPGGSTPEDLFKNRLDCGTGVERFVLFR